MDKSERFGFSLETDDRTEEEKARHRALREPTVASSLGLTQEQPKAPMDTDYQEEMEPLKPQIRFNLNFDKWASAHTQIGWRTPLFLSLLQRVLCVASTDGGNEGLCCAWLLVLVKSWFYITHLSLV